jgi:hypothetical protein
MMALLEIKHGEGFIELAATPSLETASYPRQTELKKLPN